MMRYRLGRLLQVLGMIIAPIGMVGNVINKEAISEGRVLLTAVVGLLIFGAGRVIQGPGNGD